MSHQVCITLDDKTFKEFNDISKETGMSISRLIQLKLIGYSIQKIKETKT